MNIIAYAIGAATLAALVTIVLARIYRKPDLRSRGDAQRRIGATGSAVDWGRTEFTEAELVMPKRPAPIISPTERGRRIEAAKQAVREQGQRAGRSYSEIHGLGKPLPKKSHADTGSALREQGAAPRVVGKHPAFEAPYGRTPAPSPTPAPDPYFDNPILNPIHPLHSAFVPSPSYDPPSPTPSPSYDCPTPSPSYDSGSSSSCDSPSPSPSSWD